MNYKNFNIEKAIARSGGGEARFREMAAFFPHYVPSLLGPLEKAYQLGDKAALKAAAHKIKGSLGMLGADMAMEWAQRLEEGALQEKTEDVKHSFENLMSAVADLVAELKLLGQDSKGI